MIGEAPAKGLFSLEKKRSTIQCGIIDVELMHGCFPKHSRMVTARIKYNKKTEGREARVWKELKRERKRRSPDGLLLPNQTTIIINIIWFSIRYGKSTMKFNFFKWT